MPSCQLGVSDGGPNASTAVDRQTATNRVVACFGDGSRRRSKSRLHSTSWGSLVRAQYRPFWPAWLEGLRSTMWFMRAGRATDGRPVQTRVQTSCRESHRCLAVGT
jgi:hypothetical protein